jgi:hypothetical protein
MRPQRGDPLACVGIFMVLVAICLFCTLTVIPMSKWIMTQWQAMSAVTDGEPR